MWCYTMWIRLGLCIQIIILCSWSEIWMTHGAPVLAPNIAICMEGDDTSQLSLNCCAPVSPQKAIDFTFPEVSQLRLRRPAHTLGEQYALRLSRAYQLMQALPETDPRSFGHQANIHCAYCNEFYVQPNTTIPLQIHASWLFFSFHRWYLYFHERILAQLLVEDGDAVADDDFALPFWNYDHPHGSTIPSIFADFPYLRDQYREPSHYAPAVVAVDTLVMGRVPVNTTDEQLAVNRAAFHWTMLDGATTQLAFFGQPYRAGDTQMPGYGTAESMIHSAVHAWTGDLANSFYDMGLFSTAARDPIFYAHHANLDRFWSVWKSLSPNNTDIDDPDYLDTEFVFYNEKAELVKVAVRDSLDTAKLGYTYEDVENPWMDVSLSRRSSGVAVLSESDVSCTLSSPITQPCSLAISRSPESLFRPTNFVKCSMEMLVLEGIQVTNAGVPAQLNVFLNLPSATASTTVDCIEFAGTLMSLVPADSAGLHLEIGNHIQKLDLASESSIVVTLVPVTKSNISVASVGVEHQYSGVSAARIKTQQNTA